MSETKDPIAVVTIDVPGISITTLGEDIINILQEMGHDVVKVVVPARMKQVLANPPPEIHKRRVLCLVEHKTVDLLSSLYVRPRCVVSVYTTGWEEYHVHEQLTHLGAYLKPKLHGVPIRHVSHSRHNHNLIEKFARKYLSPSTYRELSGQLECILFGITDHFKPGDGPVSPDKIRVPYNRINQAQKNIKLHAEVTQQHLNWLSVTHGVETKADFYYAPGFGPEDKSYRFNRTVYNFIPQIKGRNEYAENLRGYGMFLSTSLFEGFGLAFLEMLASGLVGVFLDRPWIRLLLPEYRYIVPAGELAPCMAHVRENFEEARAYVLKEIVPLIQKKYALRRFCEEVVALLNSIDEVTDDSQRSDVA